MTRGRALAKRAALDHPTADLQAGASAFDGLATAARQIADALTERTFESAIDLCTFCGKRVTEVRSLIAADPEPWRDGRVDLYRWIKRPRIRSAVGDNSLWPALQQQ